MKVISAPMTKMKQALRKIGESRGRKSRCNLCKGFFRAPTRFHRFCKSCKETNELFRFHDVFLVNV